ncbi:MAG: anhydro-N-acetylmuramic acid kinase [Cyclobacteriaceae bacterium]|nr:anhydro-N-acetylmuramic acid kinase [Cyclobacteriaceae bacterium]
MEPKKKYKVIGLMSGTSLDGVDVASCVFQFNDSKWEYSIEKAMAVPYTPTWLSRLSKAHMMSAEDLVKLHVDYGMHLGNLCRKFIRLYGIKQVDFISSHGHTVFHQPDKKITFQVGDGNAIHAVSGLPVVYDFRSIDVALGGQGAPLVPIGDRFLFSEYDICLNIGGIANLSQQMGGKRIAFDVCFANMGLNHLASKAGKAFDKQGAMASDGELDKAMLSDLSKVYLKIRNNRPSFAREFFEKRIRPILDREEIPITNRLNTFTESIAIEIAASIGDKKKRLSVLCTGGGTFNAYLIYRLIEHVGDSVDLIIPNPETIKFKEALVFAFLGLRRVRNEINCLKSVTKANRDSSAGVLVGF